MSINKFTPLSLALIRFVFSNFKMTKALLSVQKPLPQCNLICSEIFSISLGLAFAWPLKKVKKESINIPVDNTILCQNADKLFEMGCYEECYNLLSSCKEPDVELKWRICRVLYNMSKDSKYDKAYKKELVFKAFDIISETLLDNDNHYAVHKWYAILLDAKCTYIGIKERIRELETIKKHMDLAVTLNPHDATTLHMLGEWCYQVSKLPWHQRKIAEAFFASPPQSTYEDALEYFLRAEAAQPRFYSLNLLRLGDCYLKLHKEDQAKYYLKLAACYPAKSNDDLRANKEAAELLNRVK